MENANCGRTWVVSASRKLLCQHLPFIPPLRFIKSTCNNRSEMQFTLACFFLQHATFFYTSLRNSVLFCMIAKSLHSEMKVKALPCGTANSIVRWESPTQSLRLQLFENKSKAQSRRDKAVKKTQLHQQTFDVNWYSQAATSQKRRDN